ncbi:MAG: hypothetical protein IT229_05015 [Flavobacteriales bacterium]|nr:hypothetical protein [Flavobacteriales bacterium]
MKSFLLNLALFTGLLLSPALHAQDLDTDDPKKTPEQRATDRTEKMSAELGLNADQKTKVQAANLAFTQALAATKEQGADKEAMRTKAKELKVQRDAELKGILTPEQFAKMEELRKAKHTEMKEKKKAQKSGKPHNE